MSRALLVGRFQPLHRGHLHAMADALRRYDEVLVGVGSAQYGHTRDNPFTCGERFEFLHAAFEHFGWKNVHAFPITDIHHYAGWVRHVESIVPPFDVVLSNNPLTLRLFSAARYPVRPVALWKPGDCQGKIVRRRWAQGDAASDLLLPSVARVVERIQGRQRVARLMREGALGRASPR